MKKYIFCLFVIAIFTFSCKSTSLSEIQVTSPDLNKLDGVYRGSYSLSGTPVSVTLDVTVQNQNITGINIIKHSRSPVGKKAEKIIDVVIEKQTLNVDAISGATGSSKAILKAIENALNTPQ